MINDIKLYNDTNVFFQLLKLFESTKFTWGDWQTHLAISELPLQGSKLATRWSHMRPDF